MRSDLENKLSVSLAAMEQELKKCVFDEAGTGLVYLQNIVSEDQVKVIFSLYLFTKFIQSF